ncbi:hypothetical protein QH639_18100 [Lysinibacillus sp. 1 U-2021]|nr:hypothetical protein [Lysinibacillus sp. 1 U-2021]WGT37732.1 hypothetical protein QH639_18100 [Lysinibacillus sp. 1 U-2021]
MEMWLIDLKNWLECEAIIQPKDVAVMYLQQAKEIQDFLDSNCISK